MEEYRLQGIGQLLVLNKLLEKSKAIDYSQKAATEKISFLQYLVKNNILSSQQIASTIAQNFGLPMMDISSLKVGNLPVNLVNEQLIRRHSMVPLHRQGSNLYLATDDPSKQEALKEIQFSTGLSPHTIIVETDKLDLLIAQLLSAKEDQRLSDFVNESSDFEDLEISANEDLEANSINMSCDDAPIVKFVDKMLLEAIRKGASDIHFELYENDYRVRYRQDGILHVAATPPASASSRITARLKIMSNLDISERRVPQDGGFKMKLSKSRSMDFRVSTCPTSMGEKVVLRILDPGSIKLGIDALGFSSVQKEHFIKAIERPQGMILVTGPTGSGKTLSLYTALNILNTTEVNISTAEDPIEINVAGINQVNINPKAGLTFATALRSFLRQDPDIIMVGEIRDLETAEIAVKASQTGHLVLSTVHTNSAAETLNRLVNMGIPSFNIASSVTIIIAQRLARKLCNHCKVLRDDITSSGLLGIGFNETDIKNIKLYKAAGCAKCTQGYKGRIGLFEVLPMSKGLGQTIMLGSNALEILTRAQEEGMLTIYQSGLEKVKEGITSIEEVKRVTVD